jgi:hypothetical protein
LNDLPEPLTPVDCDLRDFAFMPLDVQRLCDSDLAAMETPEACWSALLLWCKSWHQVPCASLPNEDKVLAKFTGYQRALNTWKAIREGALRGWIECSDGRLYHPVVAEKANEAWDSKLRHAYGKLEERLRKKNKQRAEKSLPPLGIPAFDQWKSMGRPMDSDLFPPETYQSSGGNESNSSGNGESSGGNNTENSLKGKGEGQGQGYLKPSVPSGTDAKASQGMTVHESIFRIGIPWLVDRGANERNVRSMLGGAIKQIGDDGAWGLMQDCMREQPVEPVAWIAAALNARLPAGKGKGKQGRHGGFDKIDYREGVNEDGSF